MGLWNWLTGKSSGPVEKRPVEGSGQRSYKEVLSRIVSARKRNDQHSLAKALAEQVHCSCGQSFTAKQGYEEERVDGGTKTYMKILCPNCGGSLILTRLS